MNKIHDIFSLIERIETIYNPHFDVLLEDKRTKQADERSRNIIRQKYNNAEWLDNKNENNQTVLDYMLYKFKDKFYHNPSFRSGAMMRLMPLFCKLAFELGFDPNNDQTNNKNIDRLEQIMYIMHNLSIDGKFNLANVDINNTTFEQLDNEFGQMLDQQNADEDERINSKEYNINEDYEIIGPVDFKTAKQYGDLSCPDSKLCYSQDENIWNQWTNNGMYNAYIIIKKGFENIPAKHDDNTQNAYDTYGISMLFVFVDEKGNLIKSNTRWNHRANYPSPFSCDKALSMEMVSDLIGQPFKSVFKPNNKWQETLNLALQQLANGVDSNKVFDMVDFSGYSEGACRVELYHKWNFINKKDQLLSDQWFDFVSQMKDGIAKVESDGKGCNFINTKGELLSDQWFDNVGGFRRGFSIVERQHKKNILSIKGYLLCNDWYDDIDLFYEGFAVVRNQGKYNFINSNGELLSDEWFNGIGNFCDGYGKVRLDGKWYRIDANGQKFKMNENKTHNNNKQNIFLTETSLKIIIKETFKRALFE